MSVKEINQEEFKIKVTGASKVLVDCYADWCGPCKMLSPIIDELAEEMEDFVFYKLNVDDAEEIAMEYEIMSIPTLLIFEDGKLKDKLIGFKSKEELKEILEAK